MTDNIKSDQSAKIAHTTQAELDEIMDKIYDLAYDHLPERGITIGTNRIKQAIIDWHNKQVLKIIGDDQSQKRPEGGKNTAEWTNGRNNLRQQQRNKLKERQSYDQL